MFAVEVAKEVLIKPYTKLHLNYPFMEVRNRPNSAQLKMELL